MTPYELRNAIADLKLSQVDLACLVGVTPRAVNTWLSASRSIPGPVTAYVNLLLKLPLGIQQIELSRLKKKDITMKDGMYLIEFSGNDGAGGGCLVFDTGQIFGVDTENVKYDGSYEFNQLDGMIDVTLQITVPPNVALVQGFASPISTSFCAKTKLDPSVSSGRVHVTTELGKVSASFKFLRELPKAA